MDLERELRAWFRSNSPGPISRLEPGLGASLGLPDVELSLLFKDSEVHLRRLFGGSAELKVELKAGNIKRGKAGIRYRPAQIRFHRLARRSGMRTFVLAALEDREAILIYFWPGFQAVETHGRRFDISKLPWHLGYLGTVDREKGLGVLANHREPLRTVMISQLERWYGDLDGGSGKGWPGTSL